MYPVPIFLYNISNNKKRRCYHGREELKDKIREKAYDLGINLVSSCSGDQMGGDSHPESGILASEHLALGKNVIVLGIPLYSPMMSTTPSMVYQELYDTSNRVLDDMAYRLTNYIVNRLGYKAIFFPKGLLL